MLSESLKYILAAEYEANQVKLIVLDKSKKTLENAKNEGEQLVAASIKRAEAEVLELKKTYVQKVTQAAVELQNSTANKLATMRARAERRAESVSQRIFERIIGV